MNEGRYKRIKELLDSECCYLILGALVTSLNNVTVEDVQKHLVMIKDFREVANNEDSFKYATKQEICDYLNEIEDILKDDLDELNNVTIEPVTNYDPLKLHSNTKVITIVKK